MKKNWTVFSLLTGLLLAGMFACNKEDGQPNGDSKTSLLIAGSWKLKAATIGGSDAMPLLQDCQKDNITLYTNDGNGNINEAALKCNPSDPDVVAFTWLWKNNETILSVSAPLITYGENDMTINRLSSSQLIVTFFYAPPVGPSREIMLEFQH